VLVSLHEGQVQAMNHDIEPGARFEVDAQVSEVSPDDFDALILPGGTVNPDHLRTSRDAVDFVRSFVSSGKLVAAICHGPWALVEADVVRGRTLTSYPSIRADIRNAGGNTVDEEVATDGNLITSRNPDDLPAFCAAIIGQLADAARHVSG
jgi:deglycase